MVFLVVMYGCESRTVKKAEHPRIDAFELWCWRRLLRVLWTARRSNQSILKISPGCSLEGLMMKLKLQYVDHLMWRVDSSEKTLMLGGIGDRKRRGWQRMRRLDGITDSWVWVDSGSWWWTGRPGILQFMGLQRVRHDWAIELNLTEPVKNAFWKYTNLGSCVTSVASPKWFLCYIFFFIPSSSLEYSLIDKLEANSTASFFSPPCKSHLCHHVHTSPTHVSNREMMVRWFISE